jgi:predicted regulator of Ras-like GTPase activity (Roadblock/LC7/MglB family)
MATLKALLGELVKVEGIRSAVLVGRDGFVIEGVSHSNVDMDPIGAVISTGLGAAEVMGTELKVGDLVQGMLEFSDGIVFVSYLGSQAVLAIVADVRANLGHIRFLLRKRTPEIEHAL